MLLLMIEAVCYGSTFPRKKHSLVNHNRNFVSNNYDSKVFFGIIQFNCSLLYIILFTLVGFLLADGCVVCLQNNVKHF